MALLEAVIVGSYFDQLTVNRFTYVGAGDTGPVTPAFALLASLGFIAPTAPSVSFTSDTLASQWQGNVSDEFIFKSCFVRDLYSTTDFVEQAYPVTVKGMQTGDPASPALAYGFTGTRVRTDIKRFSKRLAGVSEAYVDDGGLLNVTGIAAMGNIAAEMSAAMEYTAGGASYTLTPCVLGVQSYVTPGGKTAYKLRKPESAQLPYVASGFTVTAMSSVRTQTSRQYGKGA
jgi:hypothetical protein